MTVFVNDRRIAKYNPLPDRFRFRYIGVAGHELAHALCWTGFSTFAECPDSSEYLEAFHKTPSAFFFDGVVADPQAIEAAEPTPWHHHADDFIRACCHLHYRLEQRGVPLQPAVDIQFAGPTYGLTGAFGYLDAMHAEPADRIREPIRDILASDPPDEFAELWEQDTSLRDPANAS